MEKRAIIVANGVIQDEDWAAAYIEPDDFVIAADGGSQFLSRCNIPTHAIIGDQDSSLPEQLNAISVEGVTILKAPTNKNETDLELAISYAVHQGFEVIRILGGFGGRVDHLLGNFAMLSRLDLLPLDVKFVDKELEVFLIRRPQGQVKGKVGDLVSLIPWGEDVFGVTTSGLAYSLSNEPLFAHQARGLSNVLASETATIWVNSGELLCVHQKIAE